MSLEVVRVSRSARKHFNRRVIYLCIFREALVYHALAEHLGNFSSSDENQRFFYKLRTSTNKKEPNDSHSDLESNDQHKEFLDFLFDKLQGASQA